MLEGRAAVQEDLEKLEEWATRKLQVQQGKMQVLHLIWINTMQQNRVKSADLVVARQDAEHVSSVLCGSKGPPAY